MTGIIAGFVILFLLSAFFSGAETSITATGTGKLRTLQEQGKYKFLNSTFQWLIGDTQEALTICLISNNEDKERDMRALQEEITAKILGRAER